MKYTLTANQYAAFKLGLLGIVDAIDLLLYDSFKNFANSGRSQKLHDNGETWFWVAYAEIIKETPFLKIKSKDGVYRRMKNLEAAKIIAFHPENQKMGRTFFKWGENYDAMETWEEPTDESGDLRMKNRTPTDIYPNPTTDEKPNNHSTIKNNQYTITKGLAKNEFSQPEKEESVELLQEMDEAQNNHMKKVRPDYKNPNGSSVPVTIIKGKEEIINIKKPPKAKKEPDPTIHQMVSAFEAEHKKHFKDAAQDWVGFTWQAKEFGALGSIRRELEKRYSAKMSAAPTPEQLVHTWALFLERAAKCDKFILENCFTPSKLWGQFQSIINKIHGNGKPGTKADSDRATAERLIAEVNAEYGR